MIVMLGWTRCYSAHPTCMYHCSTSSSSLSRTRSGPMRYRCRSSSETRYGLLAVVRRIGERKKMRWRFVSVAVEFYLLRMSSKPDHQVEMETLLGVFVASGRGGQDRELQRLWAAISSSSRVPSFVFVFVVVENSDSSVLMRCECRARSIGYSLRSMISGWYPSHQ